MSGSSRTSKTCYLSPYCFTWWEAWCVSTITLVFSNFFQKTGRLQIHFLRSPSGASDGDVFFVWQMWGGRDSCCARQSFDGNKIWFLFWLWASRKPCTQKSIAGNVVRVARQTLPSDKWSYAFSSANQTRHIHTFTGLSLAHRFLKWGC